MKKYILLPLLVIAGGFIFLVFNFAREQVGLNVGSKYSEIKKKGEGAYEIKMTSEKVDLGLSQKKKPYAVLNRWGGEVSMKVEYQGSESNIKVTEDRYKVKYQSPKEEVHFYSIKDGRKSDVQILSENRKNSWWNKIASLKDNILNYFYKNNFAVPNLAKVANAQEGNILRFIDLGLVSPSDMSSAYELFQHRNTTTPTLITTVFNQDTFGFFGYAPSDRDLKSSKVTLPITRIKTFESHTCPVIYGNKNGHITFIYYNTEIENNQEKYISRVEEAVNNALTEYNIRISDIGHLLYVRDGILPKQVGRISADGPSIIFYLYLESPLKNKAFIDESRDFLAFRDGNLVPIIGLKDVNKVIDYSLSEKIAQKIAEKDNLSLKKDQLTGEESTIRKNLEPLISTEKWQKYAIRPDVKLNTQGREDKFETEVILKEKPASNVFNFIIDTKGLNFYYQPDLTEEEKERGGDTYRPVDIIGSYAVYYADQDKMGRTKEEGEKYKTGKAFHIYRPRIMDSKGDEVWGELNLDKEKGILSVTVPQEFLDKASYPVSVDPTFGYTSVGGSAKDLDDKYAAGGFTGAAAGIATSITAYVGESSDAEMMYEYGLFKQSDNSLVANTASKTDKLNNQWVTLSLATNPTLSAIDYWILMWAKYRPPASIDGESLIKTTDGYEQIKNLKAGEIVYSYENKRMIVNKITEVINGKHDYYLLINGKLKITDNHRIFTTKGYKPAKELKIGESIVTETGSEKIASIKKVNEDVRFYNLHLEKEPHNYFANGYLIHNGPSGAWKKIYYDSGGTGISLATQSAFPASTTGGVVDTNKYSIYATWTYVPAFKFDGGLKMQGVKLNN